MHDLMFKDEYEDYGITLSCISGDFVEVYIDPEKVKIENVITLYHRYGNAIKIYYMSASIAQ